MEEKKLYVGYAKANINPPMGMHIPGHGSVPRPSPSPTPQLISPRKRSKLTTACETTQKTPAFLFPSRVLTAPGTIRITFLTIT